MNPILVALLISLAGNGVLGFAYLGRRDAATVAQQEAKATSGQRDAALSTASACSDAVDDLRDLAVKRSAEATPVRAAAAVVTKTHNERADAILSAPAAVPGDQCASAQARVSGWLKGRAKP